MTTTTTDLQSLEDVCKILQDLQSSQLKIEGLNEEELRALRGFYDDWFGQAGFEIGLDITTVSSGEMSNYVYLRRPHENDSGFDYLSLNGIGRTDYRGTFLLKTTDSKDNFKFEKVLQRVVRDSLSDDGWPGMSLPPHIGWKDTSPFLYNFANRVESFGQKAEIAGLIGSLAGGLYSLLGDDNGLLWTGLGTLGGGIVLENAGFYGAELSEKVARKMACRTFRKEYLPRAVHSSTPYDFNIIQKVL